MTAIYQHQYSRLSVYSNVVSLLRDHAGSFGVHIDLGCGYAAIAEPLQNELGLQYVGLDYDQGALNYLKARGFEVHQVDLGNTELLEEAVRKILGKRRVSSMTIIDTLEHLTNGPALMSVLRRIASDDEPILVVSVPNVTHKDIALKMLCGRWDVTEAGLLDHTHVDFYNYDKLQKVASTSGWREVAAKDWLLERSDQFFPPDVPTLDHSSPLGFFLRELIDSANPHGMVNQFVRAFRPAPLILNGTVNERASELRAFALSVVCIVDPAGTDTPICDVHLGTKHDVEIVVAVYPCVELTELTNASIVERFAGIARERLVIVCGGTSSGAAALNEAVSCASGTHVCLATPNTVLDRNYLDTMIGACRKQANRVVRLVPSGRDTQKGVSSLLEPWVDVGNFAIPSSVFAYLGFKFEEFIPSGAAQRLITRAISVCGLVEQPSDGVEINSGSASRNEVDPVPDLVLSYLNQRPILIPSGTAVDIERSTQQLHVLRSRNTMLEGDTRQLQSKLEALELGYASHQAALEVENLEMRSRFEALALNSASHQAALEAENLEMRSRFEALALNSASHQAALEAENLEMRSNFGARELDYNRRQTELEAEASNAKSRLNHLNLVLEAVPAVRGLIEPYLDPRRDVETAALQNDDERPFLSIVTRTQGQRNALLREALLSLGGQSDPDFESLVVVHSDGEQAFHQVESMIDDFPACLRSRIRVLRCERAGRASPINDAIANSRGKYIVVLDDDDVVLGHYVETFKDMFEKSPGKLLRAACVRQEFEIYAQGAVRYPIATSWFNADWPETYDMIAHQHSNFTPFMSVAYPATLFRTLRLSFEEDLSTLEDWSFTSKVASLCGVENSPNVTSVYRWWTNGLSSSFLHNSQEWEANRSRVIAQRDALPIVLPPGSVQRLVSWKDERDESVAYIKRLEADIGRLREALRVDRGRGTSLIAAQAQAETQPKTEAVEALRVHLESTSWRITRPLRRIAQVLKRQSGADISMLNAIDSSEQAQSLIASIRGSMSWRVTAPLRLVGGIFRETRQRGTSI